MPEPLHPWTLITQKPLTPSGASRMDIISVRRRRKRNPLDGLILSPLARINRSSENDRRRGKQIPGISGSFFLSSEWKLDESFTEMSTVVTLYHVAPIFRLKDLNLRRYGFLSFDIFRIYLYDVLQTCETWGGLWSLIFSGEINDSGVSFLRRLSIQVYMLCLPHKNFNLLSNRNFIVYVPPDDATTDCIINRVRVNIKITGIDVKVLGHFAGGCKYHVGDQREFWTLIKSPISRQNLRRGKHQIPVFRYLSFPRLSASFFFTDSFNRWWG